jgi:hypothetical protein
MTGAQNVTRLTRESAEVARLCRWEERDRDETGGGDSVEGAYEIGGFRDHERDAIAAFQAVREQTTGHYQGFASQFVVRN